MRLRWRKKILTRRTIRVSKERPNSSSRGNTTFRTISDRNASLDFASLNIEQFLGLGGTIFEEVIAAELLRGGTQVLSARRQHTLMKKAAEAFLNDIPNKVRHGRDLRKFLESVGKYSAVVHIPTDRAE